MKGQEALMKVTLHVPGMHNVSNALAAIATADDLGLAADAVAKGLSDFGGADRRFQYKGCVDGVTIIDADHIAREVVESGSACIADIALEFGCEYINMDGTLNRKKMAKTVFTDKAKLKKLNALIFPYIIDSIRTRTAQLRREQQGIIVLDAPTLFESGADRECDYVVSITAPRQLRRERIIRRDRLTEEEADQRINAQHDEEYYKSRSWQVLENDGSVDELKNQTSMLLSRLETLLEQTNQ